MEFISAVAIVVRHPELRRQMTEILLEVESVMDIPYDEFKKFYCNFVEMAVENNPSLLD